MAVKKSKSKRQSALSGEPPDLPEFFLDRAAESKALATALRNAGVVVHLHSEYFDHAAPDTEWLTAVGHRHGRYFSESACRHDSVRAAA